MSLFVILYTYVQAKRKFSFELIKKLSIFMINDKVDYII